MALLHSHTPSHILTAISPIFNPSLHRLSFPHSFFKTNKHKSLLSTSNATKSTLFSLSARSRRLVCEAAQVEPVAEYDLVRNLSAKEIQELVNSRRKVPLVIDFYATWCGPCNLMAQQLEALAEEYQSQAIIVKVNTENNPEFARDMQVRGLPTLYFISPDPNKFALRTEGLLPLETLRDIIDNEM